MRTWRGATLGLVLGTAALYAVHGGWLLRVTNGDRGALSSVLAFGALVALAGPALSLLAWLAEWFLVRPVRRVPLAYRWACASAFMATGLALTFGMRRRGSVIILLLFVVGTSLVGAGVQMVRRPGGGRRRALGAAALLSGLLLVGAQVAWLASDGPGEEPRAPLAPSGSPGQAALPLSNPGARGPFAVRRSTYGSGRDPRRPGLANEVEQVTQSVDGSALVDGWGPEFGGLAGLPARLRRRFFGHDAAAMPLAGRVWYPDRAELSPLVLMVHGNHLMHEASDRGYDYLGELLASRGFIFVSVDENFLNRDTLGLVAPYLAIPYLGSIGRRMRGLSGVRDARAWLLLEHLRLWHAWNGAAEGLFAGRVDTERIALVGHSVGGEAVALAALFNRLPAHPDHPRLRFDYDFDIRAVVALAPVDGRYRPAGVLATPTGIDYLTIHGSHDSDVQSFEGARMYQRLALPPLGLPLGLPQGRSGETRFKSAVYVQGANHGQWNHTWGARDWGLLPGRTLNVRALMPGADQERLARVLVGAFLEATLNGREGYRALFREPESGAAWLPEVVMLRRYAQSGDRLLATFDEDPDPATTSVPGGRLSGSGLDLWREQPVRMKRGELGTNAVFLGWRRTATDVETERSPPHFQFDLPESARVQEPGTRLLCSMGDARGAGSAAGEPLDLTVRLFDASGRSAALLLSRFGRLEPPLAVRLLKSDAILVDGRSELVLQDYALSLDVFATAENGFDPTRLVSVRFVFDQSSVGRIALDDLGLRASD